jgi:pilus assembly protein CpaB
MNRSRLLMIAVLALALGVLVSYAVYNQLRTRLSATTQQFVSVVVAANDIQIGSKLADHDVRLVPFPVASVPPGAFTRVAQVRDRGVVLPIARGDFVLPDKLADTNAGAGLPSLIPVGMRAVSVRVNDVVSVAGFVQPGTRVDILATGLRGSGNETQTTTVLENVAVIAVGRSLLDRVISGETQTAGVITLLVSPDDAQRLTLASQEGRIQLALRNPLDTKKGGIAPTRASSLLPGEAQPVVEPKPRVHKVAAKAPPPAQTAGPYQVEMIRGSKRDETKF